MRISRGVVAIGSDGGRGGFRARALGALALGIAACGGGGGAPRSFEPVVGPSPALTASRPEEWSYAGERGPARWATLSPSYSACADSGMQSPIDLAPSAQHEGRAAGAPGLRLDYRPSRLRIAHHQHVADIVDDGHTIQVSLDEGSRLATSAGTYALRQFHFHAPSEHTLLGRAFPLEIHFVHRSESGAFAVVAALVEVGEASPSLARLIEHLPARHGDVVHRPEITIDPAGHLVESGAVFAYRGSLTTPPCSEGVEWFVLRDPLAASAAQIDALAAKISPNARPIQPRGTRTVSTQTLGREVAP